MISYKMNKFTFFFIVCLFSYFLFGKAGFVQNTLNEIDSCKGKIKLSLVKIWGGHNVNDEQQFFRMPTNVRIGKKNLVYILDSGNNRIQVFDRQGNYKRTIGRKGQGPGNLLVADSGNHRIQTFDSEGNCLYSFKTINGRPSVIDITNENEIALYSHEESFKSHMLISIYNLNGKLTKRFGKIHNKTKLPTNLESIYFTFDKNHNIFISYYATPYYQKYSCDGKLLMTVKYEMPFKVPIVSFDNSTKKLNIKGKQKDKVCPGISVDRQGRVYLVVKTRHVKKREKFFLVGNQRFPRNIESDNTDMYRLLVFNRSGKVIASKKLTVFCDNIYVYKDHLFIIDTYVGMKIYEYSLSFNRSKI